MRPTHTMKGSLLRLLIHMLIASGSTHIDTPRMMFDYMSGHPVVQLSWHMKYTITFFKYLIGFYFQSFPVTWAWSDYFVIFLKCCSSQGRFNLCLTSQLFHVLKLLFLLVFCNFPVIPSVLARIFLFIAWLYTLQCSDFAIVVFPTLINPFPHDLVLSKAHPACEFQMLLWNYLLKFCSCYSVQLSWSFLVLHFNLTRLFC